MTHPSPNELVTEFHETYGMPVNPHPEPTVNYNRAHMRYNLIAEEFVELTQALYGDTAADTVDDAITVAVARSGFAGDYTPDTVETADALADLVYVIYGMALESSIPLDAVLSEVQRSNMSKLGADGQPIRREDGKILKGPNFSEPDIPSVLGLKETTNDTTSRP